jgi:hypothetical protein
VIVKNFESMHLSSQRGHPEYNTGSISQQHESELSLWSKDRHPPRKRESFKGGQTMNDFKTVTVDVTGRDLETTRTASPDQILVGSYKGQQIRIQNYLESPVFFFAVAKISVRFQKVGGTIFPVTGAGGKTSLSTRTWSGSKCDHTLTSPNGQPTI